MGHLGELKHEKISDKKGGLQYMYRKSQQRMAVTQEENLTRHCVIADLVANSNYPYVGIPNEASKAFFIMKTRCLDILDKKITK